METYKICDAHAHVDELEPIHEQLREAQEIGLLMVLGVGMDIKSNEKVLSLSRDYPGIIPAIGYHPWSIVKEQILGNLEYIKAHIDEATALGEIGLDYKIQCKREIQEEVFQELLGIAKGYNKPCVVHARYSHKRCVEMIKRTGVRAVLHWYSGPRDVLGDALDCGCYVSVTPALRYSQAHREAAIFAPMDRILIETDAPVNYEGRPSRLKDIVIPLEELARLKGRDIHEVAERVFENFIEFFGLGSSRWIKD